VPARRRPGRRRLLAGVALVSQLWLSGCAGFLAGSPRGESVANALRQSAGPWLTPYFGSEPAMVVSWLTADSLATRLFFGPDPDALQPLLAGAAGRRHRVELSGLAPGGRYFYIPDFGAGATVAGAPFSFVAPDSSAASAELVLFGDMQAADDFTRRGGALISRAIAASGADLVVQLGDVVQAGGYAPFWRDALVAISAFAAATPLVGVIGNHDYYGDDARAFRDLFPYPYVDPTGGYWSFELAGACFVLLDSSRLGGSAGRRQKAWAEATLAAAADASYRFIILHHTPLTTGTSGSGGALEAWLLPFADRLGVDAVFFGHDHHYEHWETTYGNEGLLFDPADRPSGRSIHWFCSGGGGARLEIDYGLLTRAPAAIQRRLYDSSAGAWLQRSDFRLAWDSGRYLDYQNDLDYGQLRDGRHYYHLPAEAAYQGDTGWLGYGYGEQTLHYLRLSIGPDEAVISVHYPNGDTLTGPGGVVPQVFRLPARRGTAGSAG